MVAVNRDAAADKPPAASDGSEASTPVVPTASSEPTSDEATCSKKEEQSVEEKETASDVKGDPEMAPVYLQRLLPVFTQVYQSTMLPSVRYGPAPERSLLLNCVPFVRLGRTLAIWVNIALLLLTTEPLVFSTSCSCLCAGKRAWP